MWSSEACPSGWWGTRRVIHRRGISLSQSVDSKEVSMELAIWLECPEVVRLGHREHLLRDICYTCMPYWEMYPICPHDRTRFNKGYCETCKNEFDLSHPRIFESKGKKVLLITPREIVE
jgi:hypothetical protein